MKLDQLRMSKKESNIETNLAVSDASSPTTKVRALATFTLNSHSFKPRYGLPERVKEQVTSQRSTGELGIREPEAGEEPPDHENLCYSRLAVLPSISSYVMLGDDCSHRPGWQNQ